jgi:hypothetical protein
LKISLSMNGRSLQIFLEDLFGAHFGPHFGPHFEILLFNILDHICTTCFVFANLFGRSFQSLFANSQRYRNNIARSLFKI